MRHAAVDDDRGLDAADAPRRGRFRSWGSCRRRSCRRRSASRAFSTESSVISFLFLSSTPATSVSSRRRVASHRGGDRARDGVGVDVVGLAVVADADRRDHRNDVGVAIERLEHLGVDRVRARRRSRDRAPSRCCCRGLRACASSLRARIRSASLPDRPTARPPALLIARDDLLVDRARQHHLDDLDRGAVGDAQPVDERALDLQPLQHLRRSAARRHGRRSGSCRPASAARCRRRTCCASASVAHGVAAIFDDDGLAGIAPEIGQRRRERRGLAARIDGGCLVSSLMARRNLARAAPRRRQLGERAAQLGDARRRHARW